MSIITTSKTLLPVRRDKQVASSGGVGGIVVGGVGSIIGINNHNLLSGLQGGTTGEYYHLTQSDYNKVVNFSYPSAGVVRSTGSGWDTSLQLSASGDRWGVLPYIGTDGVMEVGRIIDFHESDEDTSDAAIRIYCNNGSLGFYKGTGGGSELLTRFISDGACELCYDNSKKLETFSTGTRFYGHIYMQKASGTENESPGLTYAATDDFAYNGLYLQHYGCGFHRPIAYSGTETGFYASGYYGLDLFTGGLLRFTILNNGNVGIGTSSPSAKLHVVGDIYGTGAVQNPSFISGFQGDKWRITEDGNAEFESLFVRGALTVYELLINQLHYQNGGLIIGAGAGKVRSIYDSTKGSEKLYFQDPTGNNYTPFSVGAIVMVQHVDINRSTVVKKIVRQVSAIQSDLRVDLTTTSGWPTSSDVGVFEEGDEVCTIGHVSDSNYQNSIYLSAIDSNNPFMRVLAGVDSYGDWSLSNKSCVKLQIGNLDSLASYDILPASPGYGLYCANAYLTGRIVLPNAGMTNEGSSDSDIRIWAGESYANRATAPFRITQDGSLTATGVAEIGTETASYGGKISNIAIKNADIWENSYNSNWSGLHINRIGYNGGTSYYREFKVYDGKGNSMFGTAYCVSGLQFFCYAPALFDGTQFVCNSYAYFNEVQINKLHMINYLYLNGTLVGADGVPKELPYIIKKKASYTTRNSNDSEVSQNYVDYVCKKVIRFDNGIIGQFRVYFELKFQKYTGEGTTAYGQIYKNGVPYGTVRSTTNNYYTSFYEDFTDDLAPGDTIELWLKTDDYIGDDYAYARYLRIQYDNDPTIAVTTTNDP